jgi:glucose repression regulatory protein TUP1
MSSGVHPSHARLQESLDIIRQEVDTTNAELEKIRAQRDDYEAKVNAQVHELSLLRRSLYELENQHIKLRQHYEEEVNRLRSEISHYRASRPSSGKASPLGLVITNVNSSDSRDNGRDRAQSDRERGVPPPPSMAIDSERELDRLMDHRTAKRLKSRTDPTEISPIVPFGTPPMHLLPNALGPAGMIAISSPKLPVLSPDCTAGSRPGIRNDGTWSVVHNPKVPRVLDVTLLHTLTHGSVVCCVQFSPDGKFVATGCNRSARIYDIKTGQQKCCLIDDTVAGSAGDLYIRSVRFSPDSKYLATGAEDRKIRIWDIAKKRICKMFEGHQQEIYSLDFSRDGQLIASGSGDQTARIWDLGEKPAKVFAITDTVMNNGNRQNNAETPSGGLHDAGVTSVAISHDSRFVAAGSLDTIIRVWDIASGHLVARLQGHGDSVYSVAFSADGRGLVSGSLDKTLKYWDISAVLQRVQRSRSPSPNKLEGTDRTMIVPNTMNFVGHKDYVLTVAVSSDGNWVVSGSKDRCVHFWDAHNGCQQLSLQGHKNSVISLDVNPRGSLLVTGSGDCQARIWSVSYRPH